MYRLPSNIKINNIINEEAFPRTGFEECAYKIQRLKLLWYYIHLHQQNKAFVLLLLSEVSRPTRSRS